MVRKPGDPILSTQRIPRSGDPIVSTQRIGGGDLEENGDFLLMICNGAMLMIT